MTSAYILIAVVLVLGGLIAALGDRLGTKVGKARLRLFNLRPRETAALVTIITGTLISASTLLLLFGLSESLREGVFELDDILKKRRQLKAELEKARDEREEIEDRLEQTQAEEAQAQQRLEETNQKYNQAQDQLKTVSEQGGKLRKDINTLLGERQQLFQQRRRLSQEIRQFKDQVSQQDRQIIVQKSRLQQQTTQLQEQEQSLQQRTKQLQEQEKLIQQQKFSLQRLQNQQQSLATEIEQRDEALKQKQANLELLGKQLVFLQREVETLERNYQGLRATDIAITRSQVLASRLIQVGDNAQAQQAIKQVLWLANRVAIDRTLGGSSSAPEQIVNITNAQVEDLVNHITDGREYVVRILSASNYVKGEKEVRVFADALLNQEVFQADEVIAAISVDSSRLSIEDIQEQLDWLMAASQFRARRAGILGNLQVEDGNLAKLITFIDQLNEYEQSIEEIKAIATETIHTAGPLKIRLVAIKNGKVVFST